MLNTYRYNGISDSIGRNCYIFIFNSL